MIKSFPNYIQTNSLNCGLTCLKIIAKHYKKIIDVSIYYRTLTSKGHSIFDLCEIAENIGFRAYAYELSIVDLKLIHNPCIIYWTKNHYIVLYKIKNNIFYVSDPALGLLEYSEKEFIEHWISNDKKGKIISLELSEKFTEEKNNRTNYLAAIEFLIRHLNPYKKNIWQLLLVMVIISIVYTSLPFITRSIIDIGIDGKDFDFMPMPMGAKKGQN